MATNVMRLVCVLMVLPYCVLQPRPSLGFAFTTLDGSGFPVSNQTTGEPVTWAISRVTESVGFGDFPVGFMPINGTGSWDENALQTLQDWNQVQGSRFKFTGVAQVGDLCAQGDSAVSSGWAANNCGQSFGDAVALTRIVYLITGPRAEIIDADVLLNSTLKWDAYDGPIRVDGSGEVIYEFRRVVLHEYGHVVGLGHPDQAGQSVVAVMNSTFGPGSDTDRLTTDDKNGAIALYRTFQPANGGSSSFDVGLIALILLVSALRHRCFRKADKEQSAVTGSG